jgi:hypothetical protein
MKTIDKIIDYSLLVMLLSVSSAAMFFCYAVVKLMIA